jgi:hypothetical protein
MTQRVIEFAMLLAVSLSGSSSSAVGFVLSSTQARSAVGGAAKQSFSSMARAHFCQKHRCSRTLTGSQLPGHYLGVARLSMQRDGMARTFADFGSIQAPQVKTPLQHMDFTTLSAVASEIQVQILQSPRGYHPAVVTHLLFCRLFCRSGSRAWFNLQARK